MSPPPTHPAPRPPRGWLAWAMPVGQGGLPSRLCEHSSRRAAGGGSLAPLHLAHPPRPPPCRLEAQLAALEERLTERRGGGMAAINRRNAEANFQVGWRLGWELGGLGGGWAGGWVGRALTDNVHTEPCPTDCPPAPTCLRRTHSRTWATRWRGAGCRGRTARATARWTPSGRWGGRCVRAGGRVGGAVQWSETMAWVCPVLCSTRAGCPPLPPPPTPAQPPHDAPRGLLEHQTAGEAAGWGGGGGGGGGGGAGGGVGAGGLHPGGAHPPASTPQCPATPRPAPRAAGEEDLPGEAGEAGPAADGATEDAPARLAEQEQQAAAEALDVDKVRAGAGCCGHRTHRPAPPPPKPAHPLPHTQIVDLSGLDLSLLDRPRSMPPLARVRTEATPGGPQPRAAAAPRVILGLATLVPGPSVPGPPAHLPPPLALAPCHARRSCWGRGGGRSRQRPQGVA